MNEEKNIHVYELKDTKGEGKQTLHFMHKDSDVEGEYIADGTTNEAVIEMLIDRIQGLNEKVPSEYNGRAVAHLQEALRELNERTADRNARGVEGDTNKA